MTRPAILAIAAALAACGPHQPGPQALPARDSAQAPAPLWPPGFDPTRPGLQTGCNPDGTCWALRVEGEGFAP